MSWNPMARMGLEIACLIASSRSRSEKACKRSFDSFFSFFILLSYINSILISFYLFVVEIWYVKVSLVLVGKFFFAVAAHLF